MDSITFHFGHQTRDLQVDKDCTDLYDRMIEMASVECPKIYYTHVGERKYVEDIGDLAEAVGLLKFGEVHLYLERGVIVHEQDPEVVEYESAEEEKKDPEQTMELTPSPDPTPALDALDDLNANKARMHGKLDLTKLRPMESWQEAFERQQAQLDVIMQEGAVDIFGSVISEIARVFNEVGQRHIDFANLKPDLRRKTGFEDVVEFLEHLGYEEVRRDVYEIERVPRDRLNNAWQYIVQKLKSAEEAQAEEAHEDLESDDDCF